MSRKIWFYWQLLRESSVEGVMGLSKTEGNLKRLLVTAPQQKNQAKLIHVCTGHSGSTLYRIDGLHLDWFGKRLRYVNLFSSWHD